MFLPTLFVGLVRFIEQQSELDSLVLLLDRLLQRVRDRANSEAKSSLLSDELRRQCVEEVRSHLPDGLHPTLRSDINICLTILEPVASTAASSFSLAEILRSANQMLAAPAGSGDFSATRYLRNQLGSIRQQHEARKTTGDEKAESLPPVDRSANPTTSAMPTEPAESGIPGSSGSSGGSGIPGSFGSSGGVENVDMNGKKDGGEGVGSEESEKTKKEAEQEERMRRIREEMRKMQ